jgi:hypothetical protein
MTTNIKNIVSSQDKVMLTASSRLLHAEVRFQEAEMRKQSPLKSNQQSQGMVPSKSVSTLDLLRQQKAKSRHTDLPA